MSQNVVLPATAKHTATLIFLHGLGDTGQGWASAMAAIRPPYCKVICPTAPTMPVTLNAGFRMPSWFDLFTLDAAGPEDEEGIKRANRQIHTIIDSEIRSGIPAERILLGGFSQGGGLALYSGLTHTPTLAGIMVLSGWLPLHKTFPDAARASPEIKVLQCHGDCDPIVPYKWGQMTASYLKAFLKSPEFKTYRGLAHSSSDDELRDLKGFVEKTLPNMRGYSPYANYMAVSYSACSHHRPPSRCSSHAASHAGLSQGCCSHHSHVTQVVPYTRSRRRQYDCQIL